MDKLAPYFKALTGALIAGLASLQQALDGDNSVTAQEWTGVTIAVLSGLALVWAVPNRDPKAEHQEESVQPPTVNVMPTSTGFQRNLSSGTDKPTEPKPGDDPDAAPITGGH